MHSGCRDFDGDHQRYVYGVCRIPIIRFAGSADDTHEAAVEYFQIIVGGIGFTTVMMIVNAAQRGAGNTKIALRHEHGL